MTLINLLFICTSLGLLIILSGAMSEYEYSLSGLITLLSELFKEILINIKSSLLFILLNFKFKFLRSSSHILT